MVTTAFRRSAVSLPHTRQGVQPCIGCRKAKATEGWKILHYTDGRRHMHPAAQIDLQQRVE